jgi:MEMO1 family protein
MMTVRQPAVAGTFYPARPDELRQMVNEFIGTAVALPPLSSPPKAIIAPHAGYIYSGPIAGAAYAALRPFASQYKRVVLLGPAHTLAFRGLAAPDTDSLATPLGEVSVDRAALDAIRGLPQVQTLDAAHTREHGLEVHLPFLQTVLGAFTLVPLVVGDVGAEAVTAVLDLLWGGPETLIVISSDLSHYHDYATAQRLDEATAQAIEQLNPVAIGRDQACGRRPIQGLLLAAQRRHLAVHRLDLRNSGDTAGSKERVVGYGAWGFNS